MERDVGYIELELYKKLIDEISKYPVSLLRFVGEGEPSLHPELRQIMEYVSTKPFRIEFTTNGTLLEKYSFSEILSWNIDILGISIDGTNKRTYEKIRRNGDYDRLKENVVNFYIARNDEKKVQPLICIRNVIFPSYTSDQIGDFSKNWIQFSDQVTFNTYHNYRKREDSVSDTRCNLFFFYCPIRWDGSIHFCAYQHIFGSSEVIGNINYSDIRTVWNSDGLNVVRGQHRELEFSDTCEVCEIRHGIQAIKDNSRQYNNSKKPLINYLNKFLKIT